MKKEYYGESAARNSIEWLNLNGESEERKEILQRVTDILADFKALAPVTRGESVPNESALVNLCQSLKEFKLCPGAKLNRKGQLELTFDEGDEDAWMYGSGFEVVLSLYRLTQLGVIESILQCPICGRWFFAKTALHTCCSKECRKAYEKTPDKKRRRNERLKNNRRIVKDQQKRVMEQEEKRHRARMGKRKGRQR